MLTSYAKCACGAITFYGDTPGEQYSCPDRKKKVFFPKSEPTATATTASTIGG